MFTIEDESYLAKRAQENYRSVVGYEEVEDRRFLLTRDDGATLTYVFTDERVGDAFQIIVAREDNISEVSAGVTQQISYVTVMDPLDIDLKVYAALIAPWAVKEPLG